MIVLDASVLIAHFDGDDALHDRAEALLNRQSSKPLGASPITLAEVFVGPARTGRLDTAIQAIDRLGVGTVGPPADAAARLARIRATTGLKLPDCCVILAARPWGPSPRSTSTEPPVSEGADVAAPAIAAFDERLVAAARALGITVA